MRWKVAESKHIAGTVVIKQFIISILCFGCLLKLTAQKSIDGLVQAEKDFAAHSVSHGTREAFLKFLDSMGIIFENGKAVNGIETWNKRKNTPGVLNWWPQYAEVDPSGNFGYTTGPWIFQNSLDDTAVARGQYTTVWRVNKHGQWKFLVDLGVNNTPKASETYTTLINVPNETPMDLSLPPTSDPETRFLDVVTVDKNKAYKDYLSKRSILNRNANLPALSAESQKAAIDATPSVIRYTSLGIVSTHDMKFVYGTTIINGKTDNYLRIWRRETGGWKIALEVLRY